MTSKEEFEKAIMTIGKAIGETEPKEVVISYDIEQSSHSIDGKNYEYFFVVRLVVRFPNGNEFPYEEKVGKRIGNFAGPSYLAWDDIFTQAHHRGMAIEKLLKIYRPSINVQHEDKV